MKSFSTKKTEEFELLIDGWVSERINASIIDFKSLVNSLPSVYPQFVFDSLERLASKKMITPEIYKKISGNARVKPVISVSAEKRNTLSPPHPLDFDWRFTDETTNELVKNCLLLSKSGDTIALLGTPSLFYTVANREYDRRFILLDKNPINQYGVDIKHCTFLQCDLLKDLFPNLSSLAKTVLIDPPWYLEYQRAFLWNASKICKINGSILMVAPRAGTRLEIHEEWQSILKWSDRLGLDHLGNSSTNVAYETPYFERNALRCVGIHNFPLDWRRADLAIFTKKEDKSIEPPKKICHSNWYEKSYMGIRIRRHENLSGFNDPSLISILPGDVLPSVSRSDPYRKTADVWTSGNRIFMCNGTNVLHRILYTMKAGCPPHPKVECMLGRKLEKKEHRLISIAKRQIDEVIKLEQRELSEM